MTLVDWIQTNLYTENELLQAVSVGILFLLVYDFYHLLFSAVLSWFKKS